MVKSIKSHEEFTTIGENIHCSRVVLRNGRRVITLEDGTEAVKFKGESGEPLYLRIPEEFKSTQPYQQGQIKHFMIAVSKGINGDLAEQEEGAAYIRYEVERQSEAGAQFLDLNVDELSHKLDVQKRGMRWLIETFQKMSSVPPSLDSSSQEIIGAGIEAYDGRAGRPLINSATLDRLDTLDLVIQNNTGVIVTAAGAEGMPQDDKERINNANKVIEAALDKGICLEDMYVDCIVFPISVSSENGIHYLDSVREIRKRYGQQIHITGGLSNVSFGLPARKVINDTFIHRSLDAGIDSGIIDPIQNKIERVFNLDVNSKPVHLAREMLLGKDEFCVNFIQAWRDGNLEY